MTLGKAIDYLIAEYFEAIQKEWVQKPVSYAFYQTWKWLDEKEKPRKEQNE